MKKVADSKQTTTKKDVASKKTRTKKQTEQIEKPAYEDDALAPFIGAMFRDIIDADDRQIVIVCFGTTAISGDSLGPQVGTILRDKYHVSAFVYGTEEHTVNGKNMSEWLEFIKTVHEGALFIAVDASLGGRDKVGQIILRTDGVCPAAIKGKTNRFGDVGILGVVAETSTDPLMQLMAVSQVYVSEMADKVAYMLKTALLSE